MSASFDLLLLALDRADRKGYLPDAMAAEWEAFEFQDTPEDLAPKLLAALRTIVDALSALGDYDNLRRIGEAVIAKATGTTP